MADGKDSLRLAPDEFKQLEVLRNRFHQLTHSLNSVFNDIQRSQPLPSQESLTASAAILQKSLETIQKLADENSELFQRIVVHPSTNFPGRSQEHILLQLLRKKLEPEVESWVEDARSVARASGLDPSKLASSQQKTNGYDDDDDDYRDEEEDAPSDPFNEQWADMFQVSMDSIRDYLMNQANEPYTVAEREMGVENVRTGLKRSLEEEDSEEEDEDEDEDEDRPLAAAGLGKVNAANLFHPEHVLWLTSRGNMKVKNVDLEAIRKREKPRGRPAPAQ
ncbi:mediator of RNA polymerase II transcription complex subunit 8-domain-containing protein [Pseudoneurospora amorphoporcata]|uniref:Mediator of RNA polymerase II transcription subunit 8 n=1 Tax=Pseudoneurospora amorphoporcata TaxID=241081 RepID=A0AAN6NW43_9PEZI|nr:mediator of RNA polymerase II transcription complex subunit 8-domain-containing protein [Pseudoneurospora amorphoporcata]